ncbi:MAG TPA: sulfate adenylyltransferase subunit CysN [Sphingomicrobium sp.]|nr:sulfate adenylyltransferase subunit CysN [Sphingomicrobium sp.]
MSADLLRFITCGSVDDGKSTLIGRLLHDVGQVPSDQLEALEADSRRHGTRGAALDYALLVDGLAAEREQGITIDVSYRYFATPRRSFIVADCPGHEQYTRNMVTGASTADAAVVLVDARKGVLTQTRRHSYIARLMGIRQVALAVTKMDLVDFDAGAFEAICSDYRAFAEEIGIAAWQPIALSGLTGANVARRGEGLDWYEGPTLLDWLETVPVDAVADAGKPFRMPVQWVNRPSRDFRGFAGQVASGTIAPGAEVRLLPSGRTTRIARIVTADGDRDEAVAGQSVTLTFTDEVDCSRGDVVAAAAAPPQSADQFEATIVWMADEALIPGRSYWLKLAAQTVGATVHSPKFEINVNTLEHLAAPALQLNAIAVAEIATDRELVFEPYEADGSSPNRVLGGFILIDRLSNATVACGMLHFALRRSLNVHRQHLDVSRETHARSKGQRPAVLWFTGLSGAGKSTIANLVEKRLAALGRHTFLLDGDNVRHGLNRDLGFTEEDRIENIRRVGEVARLMADAGLIVLAAFISPFRADREMVRAMLPEGEFIEVFVDTPLGEAEKRDSKGLYAKARAGEIANFTGIDSPYEAPEAPEIRIDTTVVSAEDAAALIVDELMRRR